MFLGYFTDELGKVHTGGHMYNFNMWEIFNEMEHDVTKEQYTVAYDAIVKSVQK